MLGSQALCSWVPGTFKGTCPISQESSLPGIRHGSHCLLVAAWKTLLLEVASAQDFIAGELGYPT